MNPVKKHIVIKEYKPLFAIARINGPTSGPIKTPICVPIETIGELLNQFEGPRVYEVVPTSCDNRSFTPEVELTLGNYTKNYYDIAGVSRPEVQTKTAIEDAVKPMQTPVAVVEEVTPEPVVEEVTPEPVVEEVTPEPVVEEVTPEPVVEEVTPDPSVPNNKNNRNNRR